MEGEFVKKNNFKIAIASGKGGTGKTFLATSLFWTLSQRLEKLTLVDCDAEEPNSGIFLEKEILDKVKVTQKVPVIDTDKCTYCSKCHDYCEYNAIFILPPSKIIKVIDELCHDCGACSVACEFDAITEKDVLQGMVSVYDSFNNNKFVESRMEVGVMSPVKVIKEGLRQAGNEGVVIFDAPPGTSCPFIQTVTEADFVVLITEPTPFGLSNLVQSVDTLKTMGKKYGVVVNRAELGNDKIYKYLEENNIPLLLEIPYDREIAKHYSKADIPAKFMPELQNNLDFMFDSIYREYGNSNN